MVSRKLLLLENSCFENTDGIFILLFVLMITLSLPCSNVCLQSLEGILLQTQGHLLVEKEGAQKEGSRVQAGNEYYAINLSEPCVVSTPECAGSRS